MIFKIIQNKNILILFQNCNSFHRQFENDNYFITIGVYLNGRYNFTGFLAGGEDQVKHLSCCFAISDIEAALRWVRNNVGAFGGDPSRVTVVGHDTGAALVTILLLQASMRGTVSVWHGSFINLNTIQGAHNYLPPPFSKEY